MSIISKLTSRINDKRKLSARRYAQILTDAGDDIPDSVADELAELTNYLKITPEQVGRDHANLKLHKVNLDLAKGEDVKHKTYSEAMAKVPAHRKKLEDTVKQMEKEILVLQGEASKLQKSYTEAKKARLTHEAITQYYPYLFKPDEWIDILDGIHPSISRYDKDGNAVVRSVGGEHTATVQGSIRQAMPCGY